MAEEAAALAAKNAPATAPVASEDGKKQTEGKSESFFKQARDRFSRCVEQEAGNRERALEALRFRDLEQWPNVIKNEREHDPEGARPCLVADKLNQYVHQVVNDGRQAPVSIKVRPVDDAADKEVAKVFDGIIRHIEDRSRAQLAYDTGLEQAVDGGFGYWRIVTEYVDEMSFDQDIAIKRIRNRFSVYLDPDHQEPDGSDAKYGFILDRMPRDEFKQAYPDNDPLDWETDGRIFDGWVFKDDLIVAEYFRIEYDKKTICLWDDGNVTVKGSPDDAAYTKAGLKKLDERASRIPRVCWSKITAKEELDARDWPGKWIPIVKCSGNELDIEGKLKLSGLVLGAMDSQRIHNYALSAFVEQVALAPRAPWVAADGQVEDYDSDWRTANRRNISVLRYKPISVDQAIVPPPMRQPPPGIPAGWQAVLQDTEHNIEASMGMYKASIGAPSNEKSGVAIQQRERQSDTATFHYLGNRAIAVGHTGRILLDLIPKIYDTARVARILGDDGTPNTATLDPEQPQAMVERRDEQGVIQRIFNLNVGRYDVSVTVGPGYSTKRQEAAAMMAQWAQAWPDFLNRAGDLAMRAQDWPDADKIADRLKMFLPPNIQAMDGSKEKPEVVQAKSIVEAGQRQLAEKAHELAMAHQELEQARQSVGAQAAQLEYEKKVLAMREQFLKAVFNAREQAHTAETKLAIDRAMDAVQKMIEDSEMRMREAAIAGASDAVRNLAAQLDEKILGIQNTLGTFEVAAQNGSASQAEGDSAA